jgi:lysophospholipase L1-like esterase
MRVQTLEDAKTDIREADFQELRTSFRGRLILPSDPQFDDARRVWNGTIDRRPALIAQCSGAADVIAAVKFAADRRLLVAVRGGDTASPFPVFTPEKEVKRQAVNAWIRASGEYDGVIDFDHVLRDPTSPTKIRALYDSGDHGHPNDLGYNALANAIDLKLFRNDQGQH